MQQVLLFDSSPLLIFVCIILSVGGAYLMYRQGHAWTTTTNRILFGVRSFLLFLIMMLLLGPIVKQVHRFFEKPVFVIVTDNSISMGEVLDSAGEAALQGHLEQIQSAMTNTGYETHMVDLGGEELAAHAYIRPNSDLQGALTRVASRFEGRRIEGALLVSDGIYNSGLSPLYADYSFPVFATGVGDTTVRADVAIRSVDYNRIAYQGNRFPVRVEVTINGFQGRPVAVSIAQHENVIDRKTLDAGQNHFLAFDFHPLAETAGLQRYEIAIQSMPGEHNVVNNHATVYVEVVQGKKKILLVAAAPHPDIKALRSVVETNPNYEFLLHIPGISELEPQRRAPAGIDLAILYQVPDVSRRTSLLFRQFAASEVPLLIVLGRQSDLAELARGGMPVQFESAPRQFDEVTPVVNQAFSHFNLEDNVIETFSSFSPVTVHFGKALLPLSARPVLFQKVGNVETTKPLMAVDLLQDRKVGMLLGEGIWRWRLGEFQRDENTQAFDELFGKFVQYLCTSGDKQRFKCYPVRKQFSDAEPVVFESQVYNDVYEPVYGQQIKIAITDERGGNNSFEYATGPANSRYELGAMQEGVYRYTASTALNGQTETVQGEFLVVKQEIELQNLTADFGLLRRLAAQTGGKFYPVADAGELVSDLTEKPAQGILRSEERFESLINLRLVFWLLVTLATIEWFVRKYLGSY